MTEYGGPETCTTRGVGPHGRKEEAPGRGVTGGDLSLEDLPSFMVLSNVVGVVDRVSDGMAK